MDNWISLLSQIGGIFNILYVIFGFFGGYINDQSNFDKQIRNLYFVKKEETYKENEFRNSLYENI